jgi:hypothetical protein
MEINENMEKMIQIFTHSIRKQYPATTINKILIEELLEINVNRENMLQLFTHKP